MRVDVKKLLLQRVVAHTTLNPAFRRLRQEDGNFKGSLSYLRPSQNNSNNKTNQT